MILKIIPLYYILNVFTYIKNLWFKSLSNNIPTCILKDDGDNNYYIFDMDYLLSVKNCIKIVYLFVIVTLFIEEDIEVQRS